MIDMPGPRTAPIRQRIVGHAHHSTGPRCDISVLFEYHPDNPYSVRLEITMIYDDSEATKPWEVARELLYAGTVWGTPTGIGDFRVSLLSEDLVQLRLMDSLSCPSEQAYLDMHLSCRPLRSFLQRTLSAVPAGSESAFLDIDRELSELFA